MTEGTVPAPAAIDGAPDGIERKIYRVGQPVPVEEAKRLYDEGRWPGPDPLPGRTRRSRKAAKRARKGPAEDRAKRASEDRSK